MTPHERELRERLEALTIGPTGVRLGFTERLARENRWSLSFARRVVFEYKRFLYLAATGDRPVTPSEAVDQAWHLHLVYTESYWDDLCAGILKRPLHHGPTRGGDAEGRKYHDWYAATLESYRVAFGVEPPPDIWPSPAERFAGADAFRRVDTRRYFLVRRPSGVDRRAAAVATMAIVTGLAGCVGLGLGSIVAVAAGAVGLGLLLVFFIAAIARRGAAPSEPRDDQDPGVAYYTSPALWVGGNSSSKHGAEDGAGGGDGGTGCGSGCGGASGCGGGGSGCGGGGS